MRIEIPEFCLVALIGPSGSGKSHFAAQHFSRSEIFSSDFFRELVCDDPSSQDASHDAFECLFQVASKRMDRCKLTVIDATNLHKSDRDRVLRFAKENNCLAVAIIFNEPESVCQERNAARTGRHIAHMAVKRQCHELKSVLKHIRDEGFQKIFVLDSGDDAEVTRVPLWTDKSGLHGPFDIIGDVHGCFDELEALLVKLGYQVDREKLDAVPPPGRTAIFLGDLCDRGPASVPVLKLVMKMAAQNHALCIPGNHEEKLLRFLNGRNVQVGRGIETSIAELEKASSKFKSELKTFLRSLVSHYILDNGNLVVAHAGITENLQGRASARVRSFCLYGDVDGSVDELGLPVRKDWTLAYRGKALVVYGHSPFAEAKILNNTLCLDTGCVFGGKLSALRYPEMEIVSVPSGREYAKPPRPLHMPEKPELLEISDVLGRKFLRTELVPVIDISENSSLAALESMGRFGMDPRWLFYLPPTMSPCNASKLPDYLEHPVEALDYYRERGIKEVICEEKHMGSRAVVIVCKDEQAASRFGNDGRNGCVYSRVGRPFFRDSAMEASFVDHLRKALSASGFWKDQRTEWVCMDCEIMPWSLKARPLIEKQFAACGMAGESGLSASINILGQYLREHEDLPQSEKSIADNVLERMTRKKQAIDAYNKTWRNYCFPARSIADVKIAPFHILATEGRVWKDVSHPEHLAVIRKYLDNLPNFVPTRHEILNLDDRGSYEKGETFWESLTSAGAEGMVVKPIDFIAWQDHSLLQPAIKCRGREYLRIIYGPGYLENLESHKKRGLSAKRNRALKEFSLGLESLKRFVAEEPLYRIHECVYGILALESEPIDPRL